MPVIHNLEPVLDFLGKLERNNEKTWFDANRAAYERARGVFESFVGDLIERMRDFEDLGDLSPKDCMFRINRDVRFSQDKSPYKTSMSASFAPGGRRFAEIPYYLHIEPYARSLIAGGAYAPTPGQLANIRHAIDQDASKLKQAITSHAFVATFGALSGDRLKTTPQGFPRDHPEIELLRMKQFTARRALNDRDVLAPDFLTRTLDMFRALKPLLDALRGMIA